MGEHKQKESAKLSFDMMRQPVENVELFLTGLSLNMLMVIN